MYLYLFSPFLKKKKKNLYLQCEQGIYISLWRHITSRKMFALLPCLGHKEGLSRLLLSK